MYCCSDKSGFTLVEAAAALAIIGTLALIIIPIGISKLEQSRVTAAGGDVRDIATVLAGLAKDVGPERVGKNKAGTVTRLLFEGPGNTPLDSDGSGVYHAAGSIWGSIKSGTVTNADIGTLHDNLIVNNLDEDGNIGETTNGEDYPATWSGPYLTEPKPDPWGNRYVVLVQGIRDGVQAGGSVAVYGWVISAGPNGKIETEDSGAVLGGDDIGLVLAKGS